MAILIAASHTVFSGPSEFDYFAFAEIENMHSDKKWCDENYPEFRARNEIIFNGSIFAEVAGENFIASSTTSNEHKKWLLAMLPKSRADRKLEYSEMPLGFLKDMCSRFEFHLGKENMLATKAQPN